MIYDAKEKVERKKICFAAALLLCVAMYICDE